MQVLFRADASLIMGTGHVMRCLTLADALRDRGADVSFVCREHEGHLCDLIEERGFPVRRLAELQPESQTPSHEPWLGAPWGEDAEQTRAAIRAAGAAPDWVVIDHYAIDQRWEVALRTSTRRIMVIDDLANRHHQCDMLLDQNYFPSLETRYDALVPRTCKKLLGPPYTLLRAEFGVARKGLRPRDGIVRRMLICLGGADPTNYTPKAIRAFQELNRQIEVFVVSGASNPHRAEIDALCEADIRIRSCNQVSSMAELMARADLAISAGGFTSYELAYMGVPSLLLPVSDVQAAVSAEIAARGAAINLGLADRFPHDALVRALSELADSPSRCREMSRIGQTLFDGMGVQRVTDALR